MTTDNHRMTTKKHKMAVTWKKSQISCCESQSNNYKGTQRPQRGAEWLKKRHYMTTNRHKMTTKWLQRDTKWQQRDTEWLQSDRNYYEGTQNYCKETQSNYEETQCNYKETTKWLWRDWTKCTKKEQSDYKETQNDYKVMELLDICMMVYIHNTFIQETKPFNQPLMVCFLTTLVAFRYLPSTSSLLSHRWAWAVITGRGIRPWIVRVIFNGCVLVRKCPKCIGSSSWRRATVRDHDSNATWLR